MDQGDRGRGGELVRGKTGKLMFLPKVTGRWKELISTRRRSGADPTGDLRAMEAAGATPAELGPLVQEYYYASHCRMHVLSGGLTPRSSFPSDSPAIGLWLLDLLAHPWPVLAHLKITREAQVRHILSNGSASDWLRLWDALCIPEEFRPVVGEKGFHWRGPAPLPPLPYFPNPLGGGLDLADMKGPVPLPEGFVWRGVFKMRSCQSLGTLKVRGGETLHIQDCPGLLTVEVTEAVAQIEIEDCPDLIEVRIPEGQLSLRRCQAISALHLDREKWKIDFPSRHPWMGGHKPKGSLHLEDNPALTDLRVPPGNLEVHCCHRLTSIVRSGEGDVRVEGCIQLLEIRMGAGALTVAGCPELLLIHRDGPGPLKVFDCAKLALIESQFAKNTTSKDSVEVCTCPSLREVRSLAKKLRHGGPVTLVNCPALSGPLPFLRTNGPVQIQGCPGLEGAAMERRGAGWLLGGPHGLKK